MAAQLGMSEKQTPSRVRGSTCAPVLTARWAFIGAGVRHLDAAPTLRGRRMGMEMHLLQTRDFEMSAKRSDTRSHSLPPPS